MSLMLACMVACNAGGQAGTEQEVKTMRVEGDQIKRIPPAEEAKGAINPSPGMQPFVDMAVKDLAATQSIDPAEIEVLQASPVVWPDSSLGCPQPDRSYLQVLTDGARIVLRANGRVYHYHSGGNRKPFLCEKPSKPVPPGRAPSEI